MTKHAQALAVMRRLDGTVVADIRSLLEWARDFDQRHKPQTQLGGLSFTLCLTRLRKKPQLPAKSASARKMPRRRVQSG